MCNYIEKQTNDGFRAFNNIILFACNSLIIITIGHYVYNTNTYCQFKINVNKNKINKLI